MMMSARCAADAGDSETLAPLARSGSTFSADRFHTTSGWPARWTFAAIARPILPSPMKATGTLTDLVSLTAAVLEVDIASSVHNARGYYQIVLPCSTTFVHSTRMTDWSDEIHAVLLELSGYMNRPDIDRAFLARAGGKLDRALFPLLTRIGRCNPIGVVELAGLVGRDHSTVSRQTAKLEALGLVKRQATRSDQRVRLLEPTAAGRRMLGQFAVVRREFLRERLDKWSDKERATLLTLLRRFAATFASFEAADAENDGVRAMHARETAPRRRAKA